MKRRVRFPWKPFFSGNDDLCAVQLLLRLKMVLQQEDSASAPMDLNYGIYPTHSDTGFHTGDRRVTMYVDRGNSDITPNASQYQPRKNAALHGAGFYSDSAIYGVIKQQE